MNEWFRRYSLGIVLGVLWSVLFVVGKLPVPSWMSEIGQDYQEEVFGAWLITWASKRFSFEGSPETNDD